MLISGVDYMCQLTCTTKVPAATTGFGPIGPPSLRRLQILNLSELRHAVERSHALLRRVQLPFIGLRHGIGQSKGPGPGIFGLAQ